MTALPIALSAALPLRILELRERGGPTDCDIEHARAFASDLGAHGDVLQFGGGKKGDVARLFSGLVNAVAVLAFCPGGIRIFGAHYEGRPGWRGE